jgi:3-oxoadipate enol-lactonase
MIPTIIGELAVRDTGEQPETTSEIMVLWPAIFTDHRIYREQIKAWHNKHRLVVIDGSGHGDSKAAPRPFTMAQCGQALGEVLDALNIIKPVIIIGTSWGGLVAGEFALTQPQRTKALIMLNTPVYTSPNGATFGDRLIAWGARWMHNMRIYRDGVARTYFLPKTREHGGQLLEDFHQHLLKADGKALAQSVRSVLLDREEFAPRMHKIIAPTLFIVGQHDTMYPVKSLRNAAALLPKGRFEVLDTAHISAVDCPDKVTTLINDFLASFRNELG